MDPDIILDIYFLTGDDHDPKLTSSIYFLIEGNSKLISSIHFLTEADVQIHFINLLSGDGGPICNTSLHDVHYLYYV